MRRTPNIRDTLEKELRDAWERLSIRLEQLLTGKANINHTHPPSDIQQDGAITGQVLTWDGTKWAPGTSAGGQSPIQFQDEGNNLGSSGTVTTVNYTGAGVTATRSGGTLTVNIPGGGSGTFTGLTDTPNSYAGSNNYILRVNAAANAVEFRSPASTLSDIGAAPALHTHAWSDISSGIPAAINALGPLSITTDKLAYYTGTSTAALTDLTAFARSLLDDTNATTARTTLGCGALAVLNSVGTAEIDNGAVTYAKMQNVTASRLLGRSSNTTGSPQEISVGIGLELNASNGDLRLMNAGTSNPPANRFYGTNGSGVLGFYQINLTALAQGGAANGQVLTWNGTEWAPQTPSGSGQTAIQFRDEGNDLGSAGTVSTVDFTGAGVTASRSGNTLTVNVPGGGSATFSGLIDTPNSYTGAAGNYVRVNTTPDGLEFRTTAQVLSDIGAAAASHSHSAADITSGTLGVARGGTGISSYTTGNYIRAASSSSLEQRTPSQVLSDIGAAAASHTHTVADVSGAVPDTRTISTTNGLTGGGDLTANRTLGLTGQALALHNLTGTGLMVRTGSATFAVRSLAAGSNISITNSDGVSGNPTIAVTGLAAVATSGSASDLTTGSLNLARLAQGGASTGQVLTWSGTQWQPQNPSGSGQSAIQWQDEGNNLGTAGTVDTVNFTGTGVTASRSGNTVTVNVSGGGGGWRPKMWWEKELENSGLDLSTWIGSRGLRLYEQLTTLHTDNNNFWPYLFNDHGAFSRYGPAWIPSAVRNNTAYPALASLPINASGKMAWLSRDYPRIHPGAAAFTVIRFFLEALSNATTSYWVKAGFVWQNHTENRGPGANTNPEITICYTHTVNSGNWTVQYRTGGFGAPTVINTSVAVVANEPITAVIVKESSTAGRVWISGMTNPVTFTVSSFDDMYGALLHLWRTAGTGAPHFALLGVAIGYLDPP